jgi:hypothetical protein
VPAVSVAAASVFFNSRLPGSSETACASAVAVATADGLRSQNGCVNLISRRGGGAGGMMRTVGPVNLITCRRCGLRALDGTLDGALDMIFVFVITRSGGTERGTPALGYVK